MISEEMRPGDLFTPGRRVHFIGIGGAGMSALAKVLLERGCDVSGSDLKRSRSATALEAMNASIAYGHDAALVSGVDVVVVSSAIPATNPEVVAARDQGMTIVSRGRALAELLSTASSIVVAGTHGKTTTTSMIVSILTNGGMDPTYLIGGGLNDVGTNARSGSGPWAVAESDESDGSFLLLEPDVAVVTNVELDHIDHWGSLDAVLAAFAEFLTRVRPGGTIITPWGDRMSDLASGSSRRVLTFGGDGHVRASAVRHHQSGTSFILELDGRTEKVNLAVPGDHNVSNALAAAAAALVAGAAPPDIAAGLASFKGVERRFELRGSAAGISVVDDYAHHPTEVKATLTAAGPGPWRRIVAVFQPHRYSRTQALWREFGPAFAEADRVVITDVYGASEQPMPGVTGKLIADAVAAALPGRPVAYLPRRGELVDYLASTCREGDVVLTLGAGDITSLGDELLGRLRHPVRTPA